MSSLSLVPVSPSASQGSRQSQELDCRTPAPEGTALHHAVVRRDTAAIEDLMREGASPATLDEMGLTPVHLCIANKFIEPFTIFMSHQGSVEVLDAGSWSVLEVAVLHIWREGVNAALTAGAKATVKELAFVPEAVIEQRYPQIKLSQFGTEFNNDTLTHLATKCGDIGILDKITAAIEPNEAGVNCVNKRGVTALHIAIERGDLEAVQVLIKRGASVNKVSHENDTALHVAVHHPHILQFLLAETDVRNRVNDEGTAPIHIAVRINKLQSVKILLNCKQQLVESKFKTEDDIRLLDVFASARPVHQVPCYDPCSGPRRRYPFLRVTTQIISLDAAGYTPLHIAAKQRNMAMMRLLLQKGATLSTKGAKGKTALEIIATEFYNPSKCLDLIFDDFISTRQVKRDSDTVVKVDYKALTAPNGVSQMKVIEDLVKFGQRKTLIHPLIESLLYLKWKHLLPVFYAMIGIYMTFLMAFNVFVVSIIHHRDRNNGSFYSLEPSKSRETWFDLFDGWYWLLITLIYSSMTMMLLQELFYLYLRRFRYFLTLETWVKLTCLALGSVVPVVESVNEQPPWHRHAASFALLVSWLQTMFLVSRFPRWGYYVLIFGKVTTNIFKILLTSICLIIGFSFCFMIEYQSAPPFDDPFAAFVKTVVMMSSEFDYEALFDNERGSALQDTKTVIRLVFVIFVIFVAIILMNFMIGVAVSDINDLQMSGSIKRLEKQVELLSSLEILVNNPLLSFLYRRKYGDKKYHLEISNYVGFQSKWQAALNKFDYYHLDLPAALHAAIIDIAWRKEQSDQRNSMINTNKYKLNALYDVIVDEPIDAEDVDEETENEKRKPREEQSKLNRDMKALADGLSTVNNEMQNATTKVERMASDVTAIKKLLANLAFNKPTKNKHLSLS